MGAKKLLIAPASKQSKPPGQKTNSRSRVNETSNTAKPANTAKSTAPKARTNTPVKSLEIEKTTPVATGTVTHSTNKKDKDELSKPHVEKNQSTNQKSSGVGLSKPQLKKTTVSQTGVRSTSPKKSPLRQKLTDEKSKAISKVIKSLDIKISGFKAVIADEQKVECKASISEIVKTKSRAASAKISPGPLGKSMKRDEDDITTVKKAKLGGCLSTEPEGSKEEQHEAKNVTYCKDVDETSKNVKSPNDLLSQKVTSTMAESEISSSKITGTNQSKPPQSKSSKKDCKPKNTAAAEPKKKYVRKNVKQTQKLESKKANENSSERKEESPKEALSLVNAPETLPTTLIDDTKVKQPVKHETSSCTKKNSKKSDTTIIQPNDSNTTKTKQDSSNSILEDVLVNEKSSPSAENISTSKLSGISGAKKTNQPKKLTKPTEKPEKPKNKPRAKKLPTETKETVELAKQLPQTDVPHKQVKHPKNIPKATLKSKAKGEIVNTLSKDTAKTPGNQNTLPTASEIKVTTADSLQAAQKQSKNVPATTDTLPVTANPTLSPSKSNSSKKLMSVRERLQKKYIGTTFKAFKAKKQIIAIKKDSTSPSKSPKREPPRSPSKKPIYSAAKKGDDIYDFKTESESDDNIKMNLIIENSMLSKLSKLAKAKEKIKAKEDEKIEENKDMEGKMSLDEKTKKEDTQVKEEELLEKEKPKPKVSQNKPKGEKEYSDEDDRPLQQTKKLLDDAKQSKADNESGPDEKLSAVKLKAEAKAASKKPVKVVKNVKSKPTKKAPVSKRKSRIESTNSEDSENDDSDDTSSSESCLAFGPKRHRMASLNALAKVQCLYENESRTAHELGLSKSSQAPKIRIIASGTSSDEDENAAKKFKKEVAKEESIKEEEEGEEDEEEEPSAPEEENKRELRNAPGLRGMGKHWDFNDASSFESGHESDVTFKRSEEKTKSKKRKIIKPKPTSKAKEKTEPVKPKKSSPSKSVKKKFSAPSSKEVTESSEEEEIDKNLQKKRKRDGTPEVKVNVTSKRMASLNASALVAATYEVERHLDRNLDSDCSSFESIPEDMKAESSKKSKEPSVKSDPIEETPKENSRPTSTSVVIVQDTDVTITGVYVNSNSGSGQEAYCKMQYRVQSSVTEERVLRPNSIDPPKSYTPLSALSSMRPPGTDGSQSVSSDGFSPTQTQHTFQPTIINRGDQPPSMAVGQQPPNAQMYPQHHHSQQPPPHPQVGQEQMHHMHHPQSPPKYHHMHHHHHQQPPLAHPRCESPIRYASGTYQNVQPPMPPPPNSISISGGGSSAFCAPSMQQQQQQQQQSHHDMTGGAVGSWSGSESKNGGYGSGSGWQLGGGSNGWQKGGNGGGWSQGGNGGWQLGASDSWKQSGSNGWSQGGNGGGWMQNGNGASWKQGGNNGWSQNGNNGGWSQNGNSGWSQNGNGGDWVQENNGWQDEEKSNGWQNGGNNGGWQGGLGGGSSLSGWKLGGGSSSGWQLGGGSSGPWQSSGGSGKQGGYGNGAGWKQNGGW